VEAANCKKELMIEIPVDVVRREADSLTAQYARKARVPGFRPGHAPASVIRGRFREEIRSDVVQALVPKYFEDAVKEQKWSVVGRPRFEDLRFEDDKPLACKATFEIMPEIELRQYKGLEVEQESPQITEADIDRAIEGVREQAATFEVVSDRPAADGDFLTVSHKAHDVKTPGSQPLEVPEDSIELGAQRIPPEFTEHLRGARPGETKEFDVTYPEDFRQKALAGKTFRYRVEVQSIKHKVVPAADDELAKSVSELSTLGELRAKLATDLAQRANHQAETAAKQALVEQLVGLNEFAVPEIMVEAQVEHKFERTLRQLLAQGIDPRQAEVDWRKVREESKPGAEKEVRASLLLSKIAEAEGLEVTEEEIDETIRGMAQEAHEPPATLKTRLTREGELDTLKSTRRNQKAIDFVYRNAKITSKSDKV
jgi:trigger factor